MYTPGSIPINNIVYNSSTNLNTVTTSVPHGLQSGEDILIYGVIISGGTNPNGLYPDMNNSTTYRGVASLVVTGTNTFTINAPGSSSLTYTSGGQILTVSR